MAVVSAYDDENGYKSVRIINKCMQILGPVNLNEGFSENTSNKNSFSILKDKKLTVTRDDDTMLERLSRKY
jgi:hypothetical protein